MKRIISFLICLCLLCVLLTGAEAVGTVTDTLTVKVGYFGMDTDRYVEVGIYHWSELYNALPLYQNAYSFFRMTDDGTYTTVIDSAYGFYITDLLDYAGVYSGDVQSIAFYTQDQSVGYFTSFTYADLFYTQRYYFNDLAAHIHPAYDEAGNFVEYNADEAWNDCQTVQPMLALEDNWASYEIGTEHTAPNYASLGTGNRFRLLFGQSYPLERRTNQSAKYTHTLYVTLQGAPKLAEELPPIDGTVGSHTVTFQMTVGQQALRDALAQYLNISSSDSSILEITGITVTPDAQYSDLATVTLQYTVRAEGSAELSFQFGGTAVTENQTVTAHKPDTPKPDDPTDPKPTEPDGDPNGPTEPGGTNGTEPSENGDPAAQPSSEASTYPEAPTPSEPDKTTTPEPIDGPDALRMYALPEELAAQLAGGGRNGRNDAAAPEAQLVTALVVQPEDDSLILLLTGAGALLLAAAGALCALRYYSKGRKKQ